MNFKNILKVLNLVVPFVLGDYFISPLLFDWFNSIGVMEGMFSVAFILLGITVPGVIATAIWIKLKKDLIGK